MSSEEKITGALQENVLTLLVFDKEFAKMVRSVVSANLFQTAVYKDIAAYALDFIDQFDAPIAEHLPDAFESVLQGKDKRKAQSYQNALDNLFMARESVNSKYTMSKLHEFVRLQNLKSAIVKAVGEIDSGHVDKAELELNRAMKSQVNVFELGTNMSDPKALTSSLDDMGAEGIHTGIKELDKNGIMLRPGELFLLVASMKKGKSWGLIHLGKQALMQRKTVAHITLEMSEKRVSQRYIQSFFSVSKREALVKVPLFETDKHGKLINIKFDSMERPTLQDVSTRRTIEAKARKEFNRRSPLIIKQFPTGSLTINELEAWLDGLERFHKIVPDVLLIDYPDLMKIDPSNKRNEISKIFVDIRGIAVSRNIAVGAVTQGNRASMSAKMVKDDQVSEDISKIATSDNVLTYSQTEQEKELGLARLFVSNSRNEDDKFVVLISQAYKCGQFALDSTLMLNDYNDMLRGME